MPIITTTWNDFNPVHNNSVLGWKDADSVWFMAGLTPTHDFCFCAKINTDKSYHRQKKMPSSVLSVHCSSCLQSLNRQNQEQYSDCCSWFNAEYKNRQKNRLRHLNECLFKCISKLTGWASKFKSLNCGLTFGVLVHFPFLASFMYAISRRSVSCRQEKAKLNQCQCQNKR